MSFEETGPECASAADRPPRRLTDPRAIRAMAHPTRLALLEALGRHEALTATEAAGLVGESPTNCAFHLRTLAKYDFVEEAGDAPGRRRPWRLKHLGFRVDDPGGEGEAGRAAQALGQVLWETWLGRIGAVNTRRPQFPEHWRRVTSGSQNLAHVTPEEGERLVAELCEVLDRYRDRLADPERRPAGSLPMELVLFSYPIDAAH